MGNVYSKLKFLRFREQLDASFIKKLMRDRLLHDR